MFLALSPNPFQKQLARMAFRWLPPTFLKPMLRHHYLRLLKRMQPNTLSGADGILMLIQPGDQVWDIGASIGAYTTFMARLTGPKGKVLAVEPLPLIYDSLRKNTRRLKLEQVVPVNLAVSSKEGPVQLHLPDSRNGYNHYWARVGTPFQDNQRPIAAEATTLDHLWKLHGRPTFIKMDIEGHELQTLRSGEQMLRTCRPVMMIEVSGDPNIQGSNADTVFRFLDSLGYLPYLYCDHTLCPWERGQRATNYFFIS